MKIIFLCFLLFVFEQIAYAKPLILPSLSAEPASIGVLPSKVCFSPDEGCERQYILFISNAKKSLDVAIYDINQPEIVNALILSSKKAKVRVICDAGESKGAHSLLRKLVNANIPVKYGHQRGIMHNKFTVVDNEAIETGSFNYTTRAAISNQENQLYSADPRIVLRYRERFEKMWADSKPVTKGENSAREESPSNDRDIKREEKSQRGNEGR